MKELPVTVLVHEGVIARAYLARLRRAGMIPAKIVLMIHRRDPATGKTVGGWLPGRFRKNWAEVRQSAANNFWPRQLRKTRPELVQSMIRTVCDGFRLDPDIFDEILGKFEYQNYAGSVDKIMVGTLKDDSLAECLSALPDKTILFTGGGILPPSLLSIPGVRFIHVHPGCLPHVRGADGLLWSVLVRGRPGASAFYMAPGIDTGDLIDAAEFSALHFPVPETKRPDDQTLYRMVYSYYDPLLRSEMLVRILDTDRPPADLPCAPQDEKQGVTYHFMHPRVRERALRRLFPNAGA